MLTTGKRTHSPDRKKVNFDYITNRNMTCTCPLLTHVEDVKWYAEEFSLKTERFVDLNSREVQSVKQWIEKL